MAGVKGRSGRPSEKLAADLDPPSLSRADEVTTLLDWLWKNLLNGKIPPRVAQEARGIIAVAVQHIKAKKNVDEKLEQLEKWLQDVERAGAANRIADRLHIKQ